MPHCTPIRTRRIVPLTPLEEALWSRAQERETAFIAAQEAARLKAQQTAEVLATHTFHLDEATTLYSGDGTFCYQVGMNVVSKNDCDRRYLVVAKLVEDSEEWSCTCPPEEWEDGPLIIGAVRARVEQKRRQRGEA